VGCRYELEGLEIVWAIKHKSITATFVDPGAAEFFMSRLDKSSDSGGDEVAKPKRTKYTVAGNHLSIYRFPFFRVLTKENQLNCNF
jgi:hypothetical protein